jgi:alpha-galactosidase
MVSLDSLYPDPPGRLLFRGLDHDRLYRVRPVFPGGVPQSRAFVPPVWWGEDSTGGIFSGAALEHVGAACPRVHPDQVVLYRADAMEEPG